LPSKFDLGLAASAVWLATAAGLAAGLTACASSRCTRREDETGPVRPVPALAVTLGGIALGASREQAEARCLTGIGVFTAGERDGHCSKIVTADVPLTEGDPLPDVVLELDRAGHVRALRTAYPVADAAAREAVFARAAGALGAPVPGGSYCQAGERTCAAAWPAGGGEVRLRGILAGGGLRLELRFAWPDEPPASCG
jgi:hypothetical protein